MKELFKMILRDGGASFAVALLLLAAIGFGTSVFLKKDDGHIEEMAESIIEDTIEDFLELPEDSLQGKIDLTPSSEESKKKVEPEILEIDIF